MRDLFSDLLSSEAWLIRETGWNPADQGLNETNLALGNGYIGSRAVLEEIPTGSTCGTFFAGIFDPVGSQVPELVNAPNPFDFRITCNGEKLGAAAMDVLEHKRILDMRKGVLFRKTIFSSAHKKRFDYRSVRYLSNADTHVGVMRVFLTPLDEAAEFEITNAVDTSVTNMGLVTEGRKKHIVLEEVSKHGNANYLCVKTLEKGIHIAYATQLNISKGSNGKASPQSHRMFWLKLKKGETACFTKFFCFYTSRHVATARLRSRSLKILKQSIKSGFETLLAQHCRAWDNLWKNADFDIVGDKEVQRAIRFNIYHLLICGTDKGDPAGIGARSLTGEGYRGHSFWDTEIFTLPFYIYTHPSVARHLLRYRYQQLNDARKIALGKGYKGAMFPWESAQNGEEATPAWHKDIDGTIKHIETGNLEHHITADIAYGLWNYYYITGDVDFMLECGLEMMIGTARFWASRMYYNSKKKIYEINDIIGPDEFHENVNNNAFTNTMAEWNLRAAAWLCKSLMRKFPAQVMAVKKKTGLKLKEIAKWNRIRQAIANTASERDGGLIEQFDGFLRKRNLPIKERNEHGIPAFPRGMKAADMNGTQFVKQADVVLLMYLFPDAFKSEQKAKNYLFYERRTLHKSSLSPSIYAIMGLEAGEEEKAYEYFLASLYTDLKAIHGNMRLGIHVACCGGNWQTLVHGFGGATVRRGTLCFDPKLPRQWGVMQFSLQWRGSVIRVVVDKERLRLHFPSGKRLDSVVVRVFGVRKRIFANKMYSFPRIVKKGKRLYVKK